MPIGGCACGWSSFWPPCRTTFVAGLGFAAPAAGAEVPVKVAIIVGPVGEELTPVYISLADAAADAAESRGAMVARAYSPQATAEKVIKAVQGATIVIYFGHGVGTPNPYSDTPSAATTNGCGPQRTVLGWEDQP